MPPRHHEQQTGIQPADTLLTLGAGPLPPHAHPECPRTHIYHRRCDPQTDSDNDYWFDVGRTDTALELLGWTTAHLLEKTWLTDTDWSTFLYRVLRANGWRS